jgi:hypothetical protein
VWREWCSARPLGPPFKKKMKLGLWLLSMRENVSGKEEGPRNFRPHHCEEEV